MMSLARRMFPHGTEAQAIMSFSAVVSGCIGALLMVGLLIYIIWLE